MHKIIISSLILASFLTPTLANAQVVTPATSVQVDAVRDTLIALLTQLIAQLQEQIATIIANQNALALQQASTTQAVKDITPTIQVGSVSPSISIAVSSPKCVGSDVKLPVNIKGFGWKGGLITVSGVGFSQKGALNLNDFYRDYNYELSFSPLSDLENLPTDLSYEVLVYDDQQSSASKQVLATKTGTFTKPICKEL